MEYSEIKSRFPLRDKGKGMKDEFYWAVNTFIDGINEGVFELYAGDCKLEDIKEYKENNRALFLKHYIRHKDTNEFFYLGSDCVGSPVGYMVEYLPNNLHLLCRNKIGTFFEKRVD